MRLILILIYVLLVVILQSVVFARLHFFGVSPDLILVSIICFAVLEKRERAIVFAAGTSFLQDILSFGIYLIRIPYGHVFIVFFCIFMAGNWCRTCGTNESVGIAGVGAV